MIGSILKLLWNMISGLFVGLFRGVMKLRNKKTIFGFLISSVIGITVYCCRNILSAYLPEKLQLLPLILAICIPLIYLLVLGKFQSKLVRKYLKAFKDIGFVGKNGKAPYFCGQKKLGKRTFMTFKSNIPLQEWKSAKERIETTLDCTIIKMENGSSKKVVKLTTISSAYKIPTEIKWKDELAIKKDGMLVVGQSALESINFDLNRLPHVLVAGETGSGKSVILRNFLWQMIMNFAKIFMIDFKGGVEFGLQYEKFGEVITTRERALEVLEMLCEENDARLKLFRELEVKNLAEYNRKSKEKLCRIAVFIDEIAQMLDKRGVPKEERVIFERIEGKISTLSRLSRATGINLFFGVQRPDANVLTGQIKNNIPVRICGRFADKVASEIVLGNTDAVNLPDIKGRFLYKVGNETIEMQAYYFDDETMLRDIDPKVGGMLVGCEEKEEIEGEPTQEKPSIKGKTKKKDPEEIRELTEEEKEHLQRMSFSATGDIEVDIDISQDKNVGLNLNYWEDD